MSLNKTSTDEECKSILHREWEERQAEHRLYSQRLQAKLRMEVTYGRLLTKSWRLISLLLMESANFLWRSLENCVGLLRKSRHRQ